MSLLYQVTNAIGIITLNRPEAMNAIAPETLAELRDCWIKISRDPTLRCVILTASGTRAFCTGSDLKKTMPPKEGIAQLTFGAETAPHLLDGMDQVKIPIVCAINGFAIGGGLELALACDLRIASQNAKFGLPEVCIGSIPGGAGTQRLPRIIGLSNAMHMLLTGTIVDASEAHRIGLISHLVDDAELMSQAIATANRIAANAPLSVRAIKKLVEDGMDMPLNHAIEHEAFVFGILRDSHDRIEGRKAFQEKRKPAFEGR
ncbi:MAG: enoyl-CoA hydratase/isomerase family protein [Advenella sp.]